MRLLPRLGRTRPLRRPLRSARRHRRPRPTRSGPSFGARRVSTLRPRHRRPPSRRRRRPARDSAWSPPPGARWSRRHRAPPSRRLLPQPSRQPPPQPPRHRSRPRRLHRARHRFGSHDDHHRTPPPRHRLRHRHRRPRPPRPRRPRRPRSERPRRAPTYRAPPGPFAPRSSAHPDRRRAHRRLPPPPPSPCQRPDARRSCDARSPPCRHAVRTVPKTSAITVPHTELQRQSPPVPDRSRSSDHRTTLPHHRCGRP
jgi:serine/arginine repetitive matrix protein 1